MQDVSLLYVPSPSSASAVQQYRLASYAYYSIVLYLCAAGRTDSPAWQLLKGQCGDGKVHSRTLQPELGGKERGVLSVCIVILGSIGNQW